MKNLDIVLWFDDTGSMSSVRRQVRVRMKEIVEFLFSKFQCRVSVAIQNDYCDMHVKYDGVNNGLLQLLEFSSSKDEILQFIERSSPTGGGDYKEAYAYTLKHIQSLQWLSEEKLVIVIADAEPHSKGAWSAGVQELYDWKEECNVLGSMGIRIGAIHALPSKSASYFYEGMANITSGVKLNLNQIAQVPEFILGLLHQQAGTLDDYEASNPQFATNLNFRNMFATLRGKLDESYSSSTTADFGVLGEFQVIPVHSRMEIQHFVNSMGIRFQKGYGFYQLIESEKIQGKKQIVLVDKLTGEIKTDTLENRKLLGLPTDGTQVTKSPRTLNQDAINQYKVFIQSTSYTRLMDVGTDFLYKIDHK